MVQKNLRKTAVWMQIAIKNKEFEPNNHSKKNEEKITKGFLLICFHFVYFIGQILGICS
jgi:hypothetical protein